MESVERDLFERMVASAIKATLYGLMERTNVEAVLIGVGVALAEIGAEQKVAAHLSGVLRDTADFLDHEQAVTTSQSARARMISDDADPVTEDIANHLRGVLDEQANSHGIPRTVNAVCTAMLRYAVDTSGNVRTARNLRLMADLLDPASGTAHQTAGVC